MKEEVKKYLETNDNENTMTKTYGIQQSSSKREVYNNTILSQETRKPSNKQPNHTPKAIRERRKKKQNKTKQS